MVMFNRQILRQLRVEKDLSQALLGKLIGCHGNDISKYERGDQAPREGRILKMAKVLGVKPSILNPEKPLSNPILSRLYAALDNMTEAEQAEILHVALKVAERRPTYINQRPASDSR